jgi:hypothetical protein
MCENCPVLLVCRELSKQSCRWFYEQSGTKYRRHGTAKIVRSLYKSTSYCKLKQALAQGGLIGPIATRNVTVNNTNPNTRNRAQPYASDMGKDGCVSGSENEWNVRKSTNKTHESNASPLSSSTGNNVATNTSDNEENIAKGRKYVDAVSASPGNHKNQNNDHLVDNSKGDFHFSFHQRDGKLSMHFSVPANFETHPYNVGTTYEDSLQQRTLASVTESQREAKRQIQESYSSGKSPEESLALSSKAKSQKKLESHRRRRSKLSGISLTRSEFPGKWQDDEMGVAMGSSDATSRKRLKKKKRHEKRSRRKFSMGMI